MTFAIVGSSLVVVAYLYGAAIGPRVLVIGPDTWGYLRLAVHLDTGLPIGPIGTRSIGYPLFIAPILALRSQLSDIAVAQILLTAGMAVCAAIILIRFHRALALSSPYVFDLVIIPFTVLAMLSYQPTTNYAFSILPEVFYGSISLFCLMALLESIYQNSIWLRAALSAAALYVSTWVFLTKPHAAAFTLLVVSVLLIHVVVDLYRGSWKKFCIISISLLISATLASITLFALDHKMKKQFGRYAESFGPLTFFCNHPSIVLPAVQKMQLPEKFLSDVESVLRLTIANGPNGWNILGVNGDDCVYRSPFLKILTEQFGDDDAASLKFLEDADLRGAAMNPLGMAYIASTQFLHGVAHPFPNFADAETMGRSDYDRLFQTEVDLIGRYGTKKASLEGVVANPLGLALPSLASAGQAILRALNASAGYLWTLIAGWTLLLCGASIRLGKAHGIAIYGHGMAIVVGSYFSSIVVVAVAHTFDIARYAEAIAPLAILAIVASISTLLTATRKILWSSPGTWVSFGAIAGPSRDTADRPA
jgi:hypothetical protein